MPANLTPQYHAADAKYRSARTVEEKRSALEEMLQIIPKHKGTEKMQADIKRRLARLRHEQERQSAKRGPSMHVDPEGAAQVVILGPPNAGKSSLLAALTRAEPAVAEYPFTTTRPQPGMMPYEDVQVQLVDLPPVTSQHLDPWMGNVVQSADAALLLADPTSTAVPADVEEVRERFAGLHSPLVGELPEDAATRDLPLPTLMVVTKTDLVTPGDVEVLRELYEGEYPLVAVSAATREGLQELKVRIWRLLGLVRIYTKPPGKKPDHSAPFVLAEGSTILDLAARIHQELPERVQYARVWGGRVDGQKVSREYELHDRDTVELGV